MAIGNCRSFVQHDVTKRTKRMSSEKRSGSGAKAEGERPADVTGARAKETRKEGDKRGAHSNWRPSATMT